MNRTTVSYELILVNDQSNEDITRQLKTLVGQVKCKYIETKTRGWHSGACNLGIDVARGEYICLLNSDTIVSEYWARDMIKFLETDIGRNQCSAVGPSSSYCASHQQLPDYHQTRYTIKYHETQDVADVVFKKYKDQVMATRITGFCMLFHRSRLQIIGKLDEEMFPSADNESDWFLRNLSKGLKPYWVRQVYVYHFGEISYLKALGQDEKKERWSVADQRLRAKYKDIGFNLIQNTYWKDQEVVY